jgi:hypothetical protein
VIHRRYANQYRQRIQTPKRSTSMRKWLLETHSISASFAIFYYFKL